MNKRKICIVTGSRADYAHLCHLMQEVQKDSGLELQVVATGMHLLSKHGLTYKRILQDGLPIHRKVDILHYSNNEIGMTKAIGEGCQKFAECFVKLKPDLVVVLGDRFEMLAVSIAAYMLKVPIAHLHGGETTQGAVDEGIRHSITKMASLHFTATEQYRRRVIQLGESPQRVFNVGTLSLESLHKRKLLNREELAFWLGFDLSDNVAIVTYHPVTLENHSVLNQVENIFKAIEFFNLKAIFTKANADAHGDLINGKIKKFCQKNPKRYKLFDALGVKVYFSCLRHFDLMIGNSSSGIVEAPSFKIPVVNIGDRQKGRLRSANIIDVKDSLESIKKGIRLALSVDFKKSLKGIKNPYLNYKNRTSEKIKEILKKHPLPSEVLKKEFYDFKKD